MRHSCSAFMISLRAHSHTPTPGIFRQFWFAAGKAERLEVNGMVVGAFPFAKYDESKLTLTARGSAGVFHMTAFLNPKNEYGEMFGEDRLTDLVVKNAHLNDQEIIRIVAAAVHQWTGSDELQDDMTLLLVRRR